MKDFFQNQIAMALALFAVIAIGAYIRVGNPENIIIQLITATGSLVTGVGIGIGVGKNQRSTDVQSNITEPIKKEETKDAKI